MWYKLTYAYDSIYGWTRQRVVKTCYVNAPDIKQAEHIWLGKYSHLSFTDLSLVAIQSDIDPPDQYNNEIL